MQDLFKLYAFSLILQLLIFVPYAIKAMHFGQSNHSIALRVLDLLVQAAPPGIVTVMLFCGLGSSVRMRKQGIKLVFPEVLQLVACADVCCFDKTGTLTGSAVSHQSSSAKILWVLVI